jgi:hypothetical protein
MQAATAGLPSEVAMAVAAKWVLGLLLSAAAVGAVGCIQVGGTVDVAGFRNPPRAPEDQENDRLRGDLRKAQDREKLLRREIADLEKQLR